ncbi:DUF4275 family protein [Clostridium sp. HMP27]|uniref:DUF4275 family protein n=1 Tax=Clostridium sp. HMP27 TaxID=1487921 RepID=UPI00052C6136|nr:DUF4275 family protein [Clostridium sp. HMP27]KGK90148.1 hypothetical protein DP68_01630 [Clostridium sp. HMP27]
MDLVDKLELRNVRVETLDNIGKHLHKQWEKKFAGDLNNSQKHKIYLDQYLWHIFSYEKVQHLCGKDAIDAFNNIKKEECYAFYENDDKALKLANSKDIKAEDFNSEHDIYIVDNNMSWTFVHTHEDYCGPYFCRINN